MEPHSLSFQAPSSLEHTCSCKGSFGGGLCRRVPEWVPSLPSRAGGGLGLLLP